MREGRLRLPATECKAHIVYPTLAGEGNIYKGTHWTNEQRRSMEKGVGYSYSYSYSVGVADGLLSWVV